MDLLFDIELFDDIDELELIEFGVPRNIIIRQDYLVTLPDYKFFKKFRLQKDTVLFLLPFVEGLLEFPSDINNCVSPINQLLTCLRYFATGAHIDIIADYMGMDPSTAGRIIHRVSRAIASLYPRFVNMPNTDENRRLVKANFYKIAKFPNVIGAIDCTHVKIISPGGEDAQIYRNRKDYFSINVQAICDADNKFLDVVVRWPGSSHDSTIFNNSNIKGMFERGEMPGGILLGDKGYASKNYLLTPLLNPVTPAEQLYNESHIRTRNKIECTFGILKRRFPVLSYGCGLKIRNIPAIIIATAVLHNVAKSNCEGEPGIDDENFIAEELEQLIIDGQIPPVPETEDLQQNDNIYRRQMIETYFSDL